MYKYVCNFFIRLASFMVCSADSRQIVVNILNSFGCEEAKSNLGHRLNGGIIVEAADSDVCLYIFYCWFLTALLKCVFWRR